MRTSLCTYRAGAEDLVLVSQVSAGSARRERRTSRSAAVPTTSDGYDPAGGRDRGKPLMIVGDNVTELATRLWLQRILCANTVG